ncbi:hypothetical protein ACRAWF_17465 [Streptomyces sp. L7]
MTPAAGCFSAEPVLPHADAVIEADPVVRHLPPDLEVSYDMTRYSWRSGARRRVTIRAHCAPAHRGEVELPDLVLIARAGGGPGRTAAPPPVPLGRSDPAAADRSGDRCRHGRPARHRGHGGRRPAPVQSARPSCWGRRRIRAAGGAASPASGGALT